MKRFIIPFILLVSLTACSIQPNSYPFNNRNKTIEQIDLLYYPWIDDESKPFMEFQLIRTLETDEIPEFMDAIYALETKRARPTPLSNYGPYIARVYYENGDIENFASWHIELVEAGKEAYAIGYYYFTGDAFDELFLEYAERQTTRESEDGS